MHSFKKGDDETLIYGLDWTEWLAGISDTISTSNWVVPAGITEVTNQATTTQATIKLSGGTIGESYLLTNIITTTNSQETAERSIKVRIVEHKYN